MITIRYSRKNRFMFRFQATSSEYPHIFGYGPTASIARQKLQQQINWYLAYQEESASINFEF